MTGSEESGRGTESRFHLPSIEEQAVLAQKHQVDALLVWPDPWALRHRFINQETGEVVRARCNSWQCLYCGPRKVDQWRQLVKAAEPTLFVTLTKVGWTIHEASRVYTTVLQCLRRGSKGFGRDHLGARPAYPLECFAVLEEHSDFEHVGFHWHLLVPRIAQRDVLTSSEPPYKYASLIRKNNSVPNKEVDMTTLADSSILIPACSESG